MSEKENIDNKQTEEGFKANNDNGEIKDINQIIINDFIGENDDDNNQKKIKINMNIPEENKIQEEKNEIIIEKENKEQEIGDKNEIIEEKKEKNDPNNENINIENNWRI